MRKALPYVMDILIIAVFVLAPGIRGYGTWAVHEYILWGVILFYILYLSERLKTSQQRGDRANLQDGHIRTSLPDRPQ